MPTAARFIAAICLAVVGFLASERIKQIYPFEIAFGNFSLVNLGLGLLVGWIFLGARAGRGYMPAINNGLTSVATLVVWGLLVQSVYKMWNDALKGKFGGFMDSILAVFSNALQFGAIMLEQQLIITLVVGAVVSGLITEFIGRRFR